MRLIHRVALAVLCTAASMPAQARRQPKPLVPDATVVPLWPSNAPTLKNPDQVETFTLTAGQPDRVQKVVNIHNPSIELHLAPAAKAKGVAVILAAGGGNRELNVGTEGTDVAAWLNSIGVSAFILRYRLRPYDSAVDALADTLRSVRTIRANAMEWGIHPARIGIMGFSAGGEQAARAALRFDAGKPDSGDPIERQSSRPDFVVLVYAGWAPMELTAVPANAPPAFLAVAGDDVFSARRTLEFYNAWSGAKPPIPAELHIYSHGGHANGIKPRGGIPFGTWHHRFVEWLFDLGLLKPATTEASR